MYPLYYPCCRCLYILCFSKNQNWRRISKLYILLDFKIKSYFMSKVSWDIQKGSSELSQEQRYQEMFWVSIKKRRFAKKLYTSIKLTFFKKTYRWTCRTPPVTSCSPSKILSSVVFPDPFSPITAILASMFALRSVFSKIFLLPS